MSAKVELVITAKDQASGAIKGIGGALKGLGTVVGTAGVASMAALGFAFRDSTTLAREQIEAEKKLEAVIKSTGGAAGFSADEMKKMASELQSVTNFGDEAIIGGQALLATFTNIGEDVFPGATEAMLDMSAVFGQDLSSSAVQLGKALNDPIAGVGALSRVGVSFTEQQKDMIAAMVEAGDIAGAQGVILDELAVQTGGAARAMADPVTQLNNTWGDLKEVVGMAVLPVINELATAAMPHLQAAMEAVPGAVEAVSVWFNDTLLPALTVAWEFIQNSVIPAVRELAGWLADNLPPAIETVGTFITETLVPALTAAWEFIQNSVIPALQDVYAWLKDNVPQAIDAAATFITGTLIPAFTDAWAFIQDNVLPIIRELVVWLQENVPPAMLAVSEFITGTLVPAFTTIWEFIEANLIPIISVLTDVALAALVLILQDAKEKADAWWEALKKIWEMIQDNVEPIIEAVKDELKRLLKPLSDAIGVVNDLAAAFGGWESILGRIVTFLEDVAEKIRNLPSLPNLGGLIPGLAHGTPFFSGGLAMVGEAGPELVALPRGSQVFANGSPQTQGALAGGNTWNFNFSPGTSARDASDIESAVRRVLEQERRGLRVSSRT